MNHLQVLLPPPPPPPPNDIRVLTDSVPGFILSGTMLNYLVPEDNQSILATSATVGAMTSASLTALLLYRIKPDIRVAMLQCLQVGGMLTTWMAPYWINMIGVCVLMFGNFGAMTTLLPLTVFKAKKTSRAFQFGSSLAPIYWSTIINAGTASGLDVPGLFIVALCMLPVSAAAYFLVLDRSTWNSKVPHLPTSATTLKTGGVEAVTNGGDDDTPHGPADVVVSSGSIGNVNFQEAQGLTLRQRFAAMREASFYIWLTVANFLNYALYNTSIQTYFVASSASYYGVEAVGLLNRILLVSFCFAAVLGTTTLVPSIAKRVPRGVLWAPIVFQSGCVVLAWLQVGGVIPPMPLWAVYLVSLTIWGVFFLVQFQAPLFLREDERMQSINREVQIQALFVTQYATRLVQNIVAVTFISHFNLGLCETHVAATTPGVNCLLT